VHVYIHIQLATDTKIYGIRFSGTETVELDFGGILFSPICKQ